MQGDWIGKQGCGDEGETREAREGKQGKTRRWVSVGRREDPGKIPRSRGFSVQECREWEESGEVRTAGCPKGEGNQGWTVKGFLWVSSGERRG